MRLLMIFAALICGLSIGRCPLAAWAALLALTILALKADEDSLRDPLTGLHNLRALRRQIHGNRSAERSARTRHDRHLAFTIAHFTISLAFR